MITSKAFIRFLAFMLVTFLIFGLATACSNKKTEPEQTTSAGATESTTNQNAKEEKKEVEITFAGEMLNYMVNLSGFEGDTKQIGDYVDVVAKEFNKLNPEIKVKTIKVNIADGSTKQLDVEIAGGNIPDVYFGAEMRQSKYFGMGALENLFNDFNSDEKSKLLNTGTNGLLWSVDINFSPYCLCINKDIFEKAGALDKLPKNGEWTTDEYIDALRAVNKPPETYGTIIWALNQSGDLALLNYLYAFGARQFKDGNYSVSAYNSSETVKGLEFMKKLIDEGLTVPAPAALNDDDMWRYWQEGNLASTGGYFYLENLAKEAKKPFETLFVNYPHPAGSKNPSIAKEGAALVMFKAGKDDILKREASIKFIKYFIEQWSFPIALSNSSIPNYIPAQDKVNISDKAKLIVDLMSKNGLADIGVASGVYTDIRVINNLMFQEVFTNKKPIDKALADAETKINEKLDEVWK